MKVKSSENFLTLINLLDLIILNSSCLLGEVSFLCIILIRDRLRLALLYYCLE